MTPSGSRRGVARGLALAGAQADRLRTSGRQPLIEPVRVSSAGAEFGSIAQLHQVFAIVDGSQLPNAPSADNSRAMDPQKVYGIKLLFQGIHRFTDQMA